eukprot:TRINITY_DN80581_c0_g1_i1.p1 TRINITY_DN80581_c0_g1~~TRINITY_DN80581_c0_g1_i1.p1  ORF type:complete len:107 (-),score=17.00 TRINITY_DN80581_c0_g1_i1:220-540(-)
MASIFCNEGDQIRERSSVRVRQPSGGRQTFNIFGSGSDAPTTRTEVPRAKLTSHISPKKMKTPIKRASAHHSSSVPLFCSEGSQVRSCQCRKALNPPGGASSFYFG